MWHWALPISPDELLEHIDMLPTLTVSELKDQLKQRDLPVSGTKQNLETRLLFYDIVNMKHPEILGSFHEWFVEQTTGTMTAAWHEHLDSFVIPQLINFLVTLPTITTLNWKSFPTVFLDA
tara:strand:- start:2587 stop:2949 length:363 start_codon:yes stop_codon:yes gene_type:complete